MLPCLLIADRNHFFANINPFGMLKVLKNLKENFPSPNGNVKVMAFVFCPLKERIQKLWRITGPIDVILFPLSLKTKTIFLCHKIDNCLCNIINDYDNI